jgi:hypothetical protein
MLVKDFKDADDIGFYHMTSEYKDEQLKFLYKFE